MRRIGAVEGGAGPFGGLAGGARAVGRAGAALAVDPLGRDRVAPGALDRQPTNDDPHSGLTAPDPPIVLTEPGAHPPADMPGGVVPDEQQRGGAARRQRVAAPGAELDGRRAERPTIREAPPHRIARGQVAAIRRQRLGLRVARLRPALDRPQRAARLRPGAAGGGGEAAPPGLVREAARPVRVRTGQADQRVAAWSEPLLPDHGASQPFRIIAYVSANSAGG